jgi:hypothetical protein
MNKPTGRKIFTSKKTDEEIIKYIDEINLFQKKLGRSTYHGSIYIKEKIVGMRVIFAGPKEESIYNLCEEKIEQTVTPTHFAYERPFPKLIEDKIVELFEKRIVPYGLEYCKTDNNYYMCRETPFRSICVYPGYWELQFYKEDLFEEINKKKIPSLEEERINYIIIKEISTILNCKLNGGWRMIYKGTEDGFGSKDFHRRCDGWSNTITIISANDHIFGGFLSIPWFDFVLLTQ